MSPCLIIYHGNCCDGFTAAWAAQHLLDGPCELFAATYAADGEDVDLPDVTGRHVYMVDFCTGADQLAALIEAAEEIHVFDHHASAERVCGMFDCCEFDMEKSGAGLTWDILSVGAERPWLVDYVEDRDLWRHALPNSREINAFIALTPKTLEKWNELATADPEGAWHLGEVALAARDAYVEAMLPLARRRTFLGHEDIPVINAPPPHTSDLLSRLGWYVTCETCYGWGRPSVQMEADHAAHVARRGPQPEMARLMRPCGNCKGLGKQQPKFAVGWHQRGDGRYVYSLRSRGDFDVGALAQTMGGGGHPGAAGFTTSTAVDHPLFHLPVDEETMRRRLDTIRGFQRGGIVVTEPMALYATQLDPMFGEREAGKSGADAYEAGRVAFSEGHCTPPDDESKQYWNAGFAAALDEHQAAGASVDGLFESSGCLGGRILSPRFDEYAVDTSSADEHTAAGGDPRTAPGLEADPEKGS